jgi:acyl carrier protein
MNKDEVLTRVRSFIDENFLYMRPDFELGADDSLMGNGIVDSMGVMEVIEFLEEQFSVVVGDEDITEANIGTLNAIAGYVMAHSVAGDAQVA